MVKVAVEELEACKRRLAVEAPVDVVQKEWERAYGRVQKQARLPGFRKGHVPRSLVKLHFADDVRREVAEHLIPDVYRQALTEARIDPVNEPDLQDVKLEENAPLSFVAVVEVKPVIALGDYTGLDIEHAPAPITDDDVQQMLERMREEHAEFRSVERPAAAGDLVVVDYTLAPEGHEPTTATGYHFVIGANTHHAQDLSALLRYAYSLHVCVLRPKSRGSLTLRSADPLAPPVIQPQYCSAPEDLIACRMATISRGPAPIEFSARTTSSTLAPSRSVRALPFSSWTAMVVSGTTVVLP